MSAYSRWALIRGWALIRINTVCIITTLWYFFCLFKKKGTNEGKRDKKDKQRRKEKERKKERKKKRKEKRRERVLEHAGTKDNVLFNDQRSPPAVYQRKNEKQKTSWISLSLYFSSNICVSSEVGRLFWNATKVIGIALPHRKMLS